MRADEFITWAMEQPAGRCEPVAGEVVAMAPERAAHNRAKLAAAAALGAAARARGLPCEAFVDGLSVRVAGGTVCEPDALLSCGPRLGDDVVKISDPVVVEVLSPSTRAQDSGAKFADCFPLCHRSATT